MDAPIRQVWVAEVRGGLSGGHLGATPRHREQMARRIHRGGRQEARGAEGGGLIATERTMSRVKGTRMPIRHATLIRKTQDPAGQAGSRYINTPEDFAWVGNMLESGAGPGTPTESL